VLHYFVKLQIAADLLVSDVHIYSKFNLYTARPSPPRASVLEKAEGPTGNCQSKKRSEKVFPLCPSLNGSSWDVWAEQNFTPASSTWKEHKNPTKSL